MQAHTLNRIWGPRKNHFVGRGGRTGCPNDHSVVSQCNLVLPTSWQELTATQLRYVFFLLSQNYSAEEVKTFCLCRFGGLKVLERTATGFRVLYDNQFLLIYQGTTKELPTKKLSNVSSI